MFRKHVGVIVALSWVASAAGPGCSCAEDGDEGSGGAASSTGAPSSSGTTPSSGTESGQGGGGTTLVTVGGTEATGSTSTGEGGSCADITIDFEPVIPSVLLLIDQSGSMTEDFGDGERWNVLYDTLMAEDDGIVTSLQGSVRFGLALYTGQGGVCPLLTEVPMALDNRDAIDDVYADASPRSETPTGDSIDQVLPDILAYPEPGPKYIVLATDGEPDTCAVPNPQNGQPEAIAAAAAAHAAGVGLFIISVGSDVSDAHLQDMANAGAGLPVDGPDDAPFWKALNAQGLSDAFNAIIYGVRECVLTVNGEIDPARACEGEVRVNGVVIPCNDEDGWELRSPTEIELLGEACELIQSGEASVEATFPCGAAETSGSGVPN